VSFEARITAFADRFLTERTFELIVAPALADLQFDATTSPLGRARNYLAVVRAVAGGLHDELSRDSASFLVLALLPASYYIALLTVFWDFFMKNGARGVSLAVVLIAVLSFAPVMACFWPERRTRPVD
jgi:hypothetical protein